MRSPGRRLEESRKKTDANEFVFEVDLDDDDEKWKEKKLTVFFTFFFFPLSRANSRPLAPMSALLKSSVWGTRMTIAAPSRSPAVSTSGSRSVVTMAKKKGEEFRKSPSSFVGGGGASSSKLPRFRRLFFSSSSCAQRERVKLTM